eukprot:4557363-Prymnesium_polylepis.1
MEVESQEPLLAAPPPRTTPRWKLGLLLAAVALQNSCFTLVRGISRGSNHEKYSMLEVQLAAEALKLLLSLVLASTEKSTHSMLTDVWRVGFVASTYLSMNMLSLYSL